MYLPLHVAVICFVLLSGYFHIKPSLRGIGKLLFPLLIFYLPLTIFEKAIYGVGGFGSFFFFSKSPYWFIRTYFYLFLVAPVLNSYLVSIKRRLFLLSVLGFIAIYMGCFMHDRSLFDGKNLTLFMFLYVIGDSLRSFKKLTDRIPTLSLVLIYITLNILLVITYIICHDTIIGKVLWRLSYPYCSPVLIFNAVLLFLVIGRLHFKSRVVNWLAGSVFSVYILHHHHYVLYSFIRPCVMYIYNTFVSSFTLILILGLMSIGIMMILILMDKLFAPVQNAFLKGISSCEARLREKLFLKDVQVSK